MSVILSWETPADLYETERMSFRVRVERNLFPGTSTPGVVLSESATWGVFEDTEVHDPKDANYTVSYLNSRGDPITQLGQDQIRTWTRPADTLKLVICSTRPDSSPWSGRRIKLSELPQESVNRDLYTNVDGQAIAFLAWGWRWRLRVEGWSHALEFATPRHHELSLPRLLKFGTWVPLDQRGL